MSDADEMAKWRDAAIMQQKRAKLLEAELERVRKALAMSEASAELRLSRLIDANNELEELRAARTASGAI